MKYITQVDSYHIIEIRGVNHKIKHIGLSYFYNGMEIRVFDKKLLITNDGQIELSSIVLFVEIVKLIEGLK